MATHKVKWYPSMYLDIKGELRNVIVNNYRAEEYISHEYGAITINLPPIELDIEVLSPEETRAKCLELLRSKRETLRAEHTALMTKYQFLENQLLGLPAPEVVEADGRRRYEDTDISDAQIKEALTPKGDGDADIPF